jgi:single-strand DNA-binding protein
MSDLNQCNFIGRLGKDPETRYMPNGNAVTNFSIAVGEQWKDKNTGQKQEKTEWVNISAFGKLAEIMGQYLHKGSQVFIGGKLTTDKWQDNDGNDRYTTKVIANNMQMLGSRDDSQQQAPQKRQSPQQPSQQAPRQYQQPQQPMQQAPQQPSQPVPNSSEFEDDIPFN